jgi:hypothetical protein
MTNTHRRPARAHPTEGGAAMVEFAVLMLVLIPLLTYGFYLMDFGHHMLDLQEVVVSTTWDYTSRTAQANPNNTSASNQEIAAVFEANRFEYLDHTSAYDNFANLRSAADEKKFHFELGSKAAFIAGRDLPPGAGLSLGRGSVDIGSYASDYATEGGRQVTCAVDQSDMDWLLGGSLNPAIDYGKSEYNRGGTVVCWAKLFVYNYVVPEKFMQEHAAVDMTDSKFQRRSTDVETLTASVKPKVLRDHAAVSFDTWAINDGQDALPGRSGNRDGDIDYCTGATNPFYQRVATIYSGGGFTKLSANAVGITYKAVYAAYLNLYGQARSEVAAIGSLATFPSPPVVPGTTDSSPSNLLCSVLQGQGEAAIGLPASPVGVYLVARHDRNNMRTGVVEKSPLGWVDFGAMTLGRDYESTPFRRGNTTYQTVWQNKRGQFYLGAKIDQG